ncbi:hypothetical protein DIPPA_31279 [Diplonema papillatum]|nr:hypothetical protein DIPPA_31279 [Diplonema papillatum]
MRAVRIQRRFVARSCHRSGKGHAGRLEGVAGMREQPVPDALRSNAAAPGVLKTQATVLRARLDHELGDVTDLLDDLEYDAAQKGWDAKYASAVQKLEAFLQLHADERRALGGVPGQRFDFWFRPRIREVRNWLYVVADKRSQYLNTRERLLLLVDDQNGSMPGSSSDLVPTLQDDIHSLREAANTKLHTLANDDMYKLWRAEGRPTLEEWDTTSPHKRYLNLPGYSRSCT